MSSRTRTSPPPEPVAGSSTCRCSTERTVRRRSRSLGVDLGLAAGGGGPRGGRVAQLGGLDLGGSRSGHVGREGRVVDHGQVLRGRLRGDVAVVLALTVGVEDVGDDLLGLVDTLGAGDDGRGGVPTRTGGLALVLDDLDIIGALERVGRDLTGGSGRTGAGG